MVGAFDESYRDREFWTFEEPFIFMTEHKTTRMSELNDGQGADIDHLLVPMVKFLNRLGVTTISSCQGDPGIIGEGGRYGHIYFITAYRWNSTSLVQFTFGFLRDFVRHLYDDVRLSVHISEDSGYWAEMSFRNEAIEEVTKRLGTYCEMNHK